MGKIRDTLLLDISEDIKKVIDLEDQTENEIQNEIENYIITPKLSEYLAKFIQIYKSNIKESGVWISGFYGSGKSYFGKNIGHIIANKSINGTTARERFIQRLRGLQNENLLENDIRSLDSFQSRVIFLDVAKQNTDKGGLAWVLFRNFLGSLGFLNNSIGIIEYSMFLDDSYQEFISKVEELEKKQWSVIKSDIQHPIFFRRVITKYKFTEKEYDDLKKSVDNIIESFDAAKLREYLKLYLDKNKDERVVFIFDEASEAIGSKKFSLLDLEGISEALSSLSRKVWTIAIAQEKLDDVIHNANVNKNQLVKVTDRFKTQLHLESTEVEFIIKNRLLKKTDEAYNNLVDFYNGKVGQITDFTKLKASFNTAIESADEFATFYPFHKYQFRLLQNFLFKSNILAKTQIAERGMIITAFDVLKNRLKDKSLYYSASSFDIVSEGQINPPISLTGKYNKARKKLNELNLEANGEDLLKVIHFLTESESEADANIDNISRCYLENLNDNIYKIKATIEKALAALVEVDILIETNGVYKIASDQEQKLKSEMNDISVETYIKKRRLIEHLKKQMFVKGLGSLTIDGATYNFWVHSDIEDDIVSTSNKSIKIKIYSIYSLEEDVDKFIETQKLQSLTDKNSIYIVPTQHNVSEINKLFDEIYRYEQIELRYQSDNDPNLRQIVRNFSTIKESKEQRLVQLINKTYQTATVFYRGEEKKTDGDTFRTVITDLQKRLISNIYTKKLNSQLLEALAKNVLKETNQSNLSTIFTGNDFKFFDNNGNFIGDNLKVIEEINNKLKISYMDGKSLESLLNEPPCGYQFGTINTTLAVLSRAGRLVVKYNSREIFDYKDEDILKVFTNAREFQKASFKTINKTLSAAQKNELVNALIDIKIKDIIDRTVGYNTTDFELVESITKASELLLDRVKTMQANTARFDKLFPNANEIFQLLKEYTSKTTESNYIDKAISFLSNVEQYKKTVQKVKEIEIFKNKKLPLAEKYAEFVKRIKQELEKMGIGYKESAIESLINQFENIFESSLTEKYAEIEKLAQKIKDAYFVLLDKEHTKMINAHLDLKKKAEDLMLKIESVSKTVNINLITEAKEIIGYANKRICTNLELEYDTHCNTCLFTLYEMFSGNETINQRYSKLIDLESKIRKEEPKEEISKEISIPKIKLTVPRGIIKVGEYKKLLKEELGKIDKLDNFDSIELTINIEDK